jgi:hypothetical protein
VTYCIRRLLFVTLGCCLLPAETPDVPKELRVPDGQTLLLRLHGEGKQIYSCLNAAGVYAWKLKGPEARLIDEDGKVVGRHFAGPTWESTDGSRVTGKLAASVASPDAGSIPRLLLSAASHEGAGVMQRVLSIQRLDTKGGVAPSTGCAAGSENAETSIPYEASYYFYGAAGK